MQLVCQQVAAAWLAVDLVPVHTWYVIATCLERLIQHHVIHSVINTAQSSHGQCPRMFMFAASCKAML